MSAFTSRTRIPQLDGLRGVAILMVLLYHYVGWSVLFGAPYLFGPLSWLVGPGWTGVDLFFVLSGFLIGGILIDARGSSNYFRVFYARRFCRIFPLYFGFLAVAAIASKIPVEPLWHSAVALPWRWSVLFLQNFWMARYHIAGGEFIGPTWSLAVEEQFYLIIPAVIYFVAPKNLPRVLLGGIIVAPVVRMSIFLTIAHSAMATQVLHPCRMDSLLIGVATAYLVRQPGIVNQQRLWTAIEVLTIICSSTLFLDSRDNFITNLVLYDCIAVLFACILVAALRDPWLASVQGGWLRELGKVSYGLYLLHAVGFAIALAILPAIRYRGLAAAGIGLVITIGAAKTSWEYLEKPFLQLGRRLSYDSAKHTTGSVSSERVQAV